MKQIFLYCDRGVDKRLAQELFVQLNQQSACKFISAHEIINTSWQESADLLVIPGGRDLPYVGLLQQRGTDRIKEYVFHGGRFLGICAGAYFASSYVEFDRGGPLHIEGERELKFFPGKAIGPLFGPFYYGNEKGAKIVSITYDGRRFHNYYNGGCFFEQTSSVGYQVLATYENNLPAIVRCEVGTGLAILSGVHFEKSLKNKQHEEERQLLMASVLQHF